MIRMLEDYRGNDASGCILTIRWKRTAYADGMGKWRERWDYVLGIEPGFKSELENIDTSELPDLPNHTLVERVYLESEPEAYAYLAGAYRLDELSFVLDDSGWWKILHLPTGLYLRYKDRELTAEEDEEKLLGGWDPEVARIMAEMEGDEFLLALERAEESTLQWLLDEEGPDAEGIEWIEEADGERYPTLSEEMRKEIYEELKRDYEEELEKARRLEDPGDRGEVLSKEGFVDAECIRPLPEGNLFLFDTEDLDEDFRSLFLSELDVLAKP